MAGARRGPQVLRRVVVVHDALGLREPVVEQPPHPAGAVAVADREPDVLRRVARRRQFAQQAALELRLPAGRLRRALHGREQHHRTRHRARAAPAVPLRHPQGAHLGLPRGGPFAILPGAPDGLRRPRRHSRAVQRAAQSLPLLQRLALRQRRRRRARGRRLQRRLPPRLQIRAHRPRRPFDPLRAQVQTRQLAHQLVGPLVARLRTRHARQPPRRQRHRTPDVQQPLARARAAPALPARPPRHLHPHGAHHRFHRRLLAPRQPRPAPAVRTRPGRRVVLPARHPQTPSRRLQRHRPQPAVQQRRRRRTGLRTRQLQRREPRHRRVQFPAHLVPGLPRLFALAFPLQLVDSSLRHGRASLPLVAFGKHQEYRGPPWLSNSPNAPTVTDPAIASRE